MFWSSFNQDIKHPHRGTIPVNKSPKGPAHQIPQDHVHALPLPNPTESQTTSYTSIHHPNTQRPAIMRSLKPADVRHSHWFPRPSWRESRLETPYAAGLVGNKIVCCTHVSPRSIWIEQARTRTKPWDLAIMTRTLFAF
ncbi:hypothetical protein BJX99DRAFT_221232 [Aspergillus californicus]